MFLLSVYFETKLETVSFVYGFVFRNHSFVYISIQNFQESACFFILTLSETEQSCALHIKTLNQT